MTVYSAYIKSHGGGALILLKRLLRHLADNGEHVIYSAPEPFPGLDHPNVTFLALSCPYNLGLFGKVIMLCQIIAHVQAVSRKYKIDVAISMGGLYAGLFTPLKRKNTRVLTYIVGDQLKELILTKTNPLAIGVAQVILKYGMKNSDTILCISNDLAASTRKLHSSAESKIIIQSGSLPKNNQVPEQEISRLREELGLSGQLVLAFVGPLMPIKRIDLLLKAIPIIAEKHRVRILIIGSGKEDDNLKALAKKLNIEPLVHFAGWQDKPLLYMAASDILILPSDYEGFGLVLMEALSVSTLIIGTRTGGIPDVINRDDLLFTPGDHKGLAGCVLNAVNANGKVKDELLEFCKERANTYSFDWERRVTQHIQNMTGKQA